MDYVKNTCKIGQGSDCCRYLVMGRGLECANHGNMKKILDKKAADNTMVAISQNCEGYGV